MSLYYRVIVVGSIESKDYLVLILSDLKKGRTTTAREQYSVNDLPFFATLCLAVGKILETCCSTFC